MSHAERQDTVSKVGFGYKAWLTMPEPGHLFWQQHRYHVVYPALLADDSEKYIADLLSYKADNPGLVFLYLLEELGHAILKFDARELLAFRSRTMCQIRKT